MFEPGSETDSLFQKLIFLVRDIWAAMTSSAVSCCSSYFPQRTGKSPLVMSVIWSAAPPPKSGQSPFCLWKKNWSANVLKHRSLSTRTFLPSALCPRSISGYDFFSSQGVCQNDLEGKKNAFFDFVRSDITRRRKHSLRIVDLSWPESISLKNRNSSIF